MAPSRGHAGERLTPVGGRVVRSLRVAPSAEGEAGPLVVVLPGLGLPFYTLPTARALAARGVDCEVLDLPGIRVGAAAPGPGKHPRHRVAGCCVDAGPGR